MRNKNYKNLFPIRRCYLNLVYMGYKALFFKYEIKNQIKILSFSLVKKKIKKLFLNLSLLSFIKKIKTENKKWENSLLILSSSLSAAQ